MSYLCRVNISNMTIELITGVKEVNGIYVPIKQKTTFNAPYMQYFKDFERKRAELDRCSSMLLGFLITTIDDQNRVYINKIIKNDFIKYSQEILGLEKAYSQTSINNALSKLRKADILIQTYSVGVNYLNPVLVFKGSQEERAKVIKRINEEMIKSNAFLIENEKQNRRHIQD